LSAFVATAPEADYMDNALFWMGECHYGMGDYPQALSYFQRVVSEYPDGNKVVDSLLKVALSHERLEQPEQAVEVLSVLVETYPSTDAARRATERLRALQ
jgi:tol-pal system protein YbgF